MTATKVLTETEQFEVPKRGMPVTILLAFWVVEKRHSSIIFCKIAKI